MDKQRMLSRIGSGVSLPMALLLVIFFFLPWLELHCGAMKLGKASGWQLSVGKMTAEQQDQAQAKEGDGPDARPWFFLGLLIPICVLAVGWRGLAGALQPGRVGMLLALLGVVGLVVMIVAANVDYADEIAEDMKKQSETRAPASEDERAAQGLQKEMAAQMSSQVAEQIRTEPTGILWVCLVLYVLVGATGAAVLVAPKVLPPAAARPPQPAKIEPPPPPTT